MDEVTEIDLESAIAGVYLVLAELLDTLPESGWDTPSLCERWRVRGVVAHMSMPVRYSPEQFGAELQACGGDFTRLSKTLAGRDAALPVDVLVGNLRDETLHAWTPPGGGTTCALNHVVIHGLDITVPLGASRRSPDGTIRAVLDDLTVGGTHTHFGFDLDGINLQATDLDWSFGSGTPTTGAAGDLALFVCGRKLPAGRIDGI
ncbi:MAG TPA: maleylpyruvate isomerase family mycothiol-dependent enzyme [Acidimicrobiales bacterium]|nr:maleylpyruvate isomerase family mycothiol-dependent enzyme [Acidimicrobiales bacterium]